MQVNKPQLRRSSKYFYLFGLVYCCSFLSACAPAMLGWQYQSYAELGWMPVRDNDTANKSGFKRLQTHMQVDKNIRDFVTRMKLPDYVHVPALRTLDLAYLDKGVIYQFETYSGKPPREIKWSNISQLPVFVAQQFLNRANTPTPSTDKPTPQTRIARQEAHNRSRKERRVALVVGNSGYQHTAPLANPINDANEFGNALKNLGFETDVVIDATKGEFEISLRSFSNRLEGSSAALFFYAGHGLQVDGKNYLVPIDARLKNKRDLKYETVALNGVLEDMEGANHVRLVFLDACRDNPLSKSLSYSLGKNSRSVVGRGLARVDTATGTLISYATKDGATAADGSGFNSPYTEALLQHIKSPGLEIGLMLRRVRKSVLEATSEEQVPWEYGSLLGEFYMVPQ